MDNFLNTHQVPKLKQDQISHLNSLIGPEEIEAVANSLPTTTITKSPGPDGFTGEIYQVFKENLIPLLFKLVHKIETQGTLPNSFYEATIMCIPKLNKDQTRKENFRPISLMNVDAKNTQ